MTFTTKMYTFCCRQGSGSPQFHGPMSPRRRALVSASRRQPWPRSRPSRWPHSRRSRSPSSCRPPPGGANDAMARVVGQRCRRVLKQPIIVDNRAGANGAIASEFVKRAAPDGYTLMLGYIATHAMNPSLQKLRYDPVKDFEPVGMVGVSATLHGRESDGQGQQREGTGGVAEGAARQDRTTRRPATAPRRISRPRCSSCPPVPACCTCRTRGRRRRSPTPSAARPQVMFPSLFTRHSLRQGRQAEGDRRGRRQALGADARRADAQEQGIASVDVSQWYGIFAPAKTPRPVLEQLNKALNEVLRQGSRQAPRASTAPRS